MIKKEKSSKLIILGKLTAWNAWQRYSDVNVALEDLSKSAAIFKNEDMTLLERFICLTYSEAVVQRCSVKKVLLEISQNSQENTFLHRAPLVAASVAL